MLAQQRTERQGAVEVRQNCHTCNDLDKMGTQRRPYILDKREPVNLRSVVKKLERERGVSEQPIKKEIRG